MKRLQLSTLKDGARFVYGGVEWVKLAYVGTPTATVIGFYSWKAKAENVVKIKKANPAETDGMPVDLNNIQP